MSVVVALVHGCVYSGVWIKRGEMRMIQIIVKDKFFCNGKSFDQLIGVEATREEAIEYVARLIYREPKMDNYVIEFKDFDKA